MSALIDSVHPDWLAILGNDPEPQPCCPSGALVPEDVHAETGCDWQPRPWMEGSR